MGAGRPPKFKTVAEMQKKIDGYFAECAADELPATVTGLCLALDLTRQGLLEYGEKDKFSDTVKKAKLRVEHGIELGLLTGRNPAGCIFNLKNNFGWQDKVEKVVTSENTHKHTGMITFVGTAPDED